MVRNVIALAAVLVAPLPAWAQLPTFSTLDRPDDTSRLGLQLGLHLLDIPRVDAFGIRLEPYGQYVFPRSRFGIYGHLPISHLSVDDADDETAIQNLELGGFFLLGSPGRHVALRGGLSLPTADDDLSGLATNAFTGFERITDLVGIAPDSTWLRLSASPLLAHDRIFFRGDLGFDFKVDDDRGGRDDDLFAHLNAGLGVLLGGWALLFELANQANLDGDGDADDRYLHTLSVGVRSLGQTQAHVGIVLPLDESVRDLVPIIFTLGIQGTTF